LCIVDENGKVLVAKTGMGSSAAMTTALVGAILHFFGVVNLQDDVRGLRHDSKSTHVSPEADTRSKSTVHNLAQLAHAVAQGKIGSGFDVSAAVYGSQIYQRFNQDNFKDEYASISQQKICDDALFNCVTNEELWDQTVAPLQLPPGLDVVMGDVMGGSSSSSMARGVLKWKNSSADAPAIWNGLADNNKAISQVLGELLQASKVIVYYIFLSSIFWYLYWFCDLNECQVHVHAYKTVILRASKVPHTEWKELVCDGAAEKDIVDLLLYTKAKFKKSRELLKRMGDCAGQGIEPAEQTALADDTEALPGVLCAGVPGAGGVDAIFAITLSTGARSGVEEMWSQRDNNGGFVCPLMLSTSSEKSGICFEKNISWD
jgi:phosphomevalonate kinase